MGSYIFLKGQSSTYATLQTGSLGLMYQLVLQLPACVSRQQFASASYQQNLLLVGPVIYLAGYVHTSWTHNVLHYWRVTVRPAIREWWQEVSVEKAQGVVGMREAQHWHQ